jgi:hypothetical protein
MHDRLSRLPRTRNEKALAEALAKHKKAQLVTADAEFKAIEREVKVCWLAAK